MASSTWHLRLDDEQKTRWEDVAQAAGLSLAEFVRVAVEDKIVDRSSKAIARAVARELLPEIERIVAQPRPTEEGQPPQRPWDPQCDNEVAHQLNVVCSWCGGSYR